MRPGAGRPSAISIPSEAPPPREKTIPAHTRKAAQSNLAESEGESLPFFDESKVPVETIAGKEATVMGDDPPEVKRGFRSQVVGGEVPVEPTGYVYNKDHDDFRLAGDPAIEADGFETVHGLDNATERGDIAANEEDVSNVGDSTPA